MNPSYTRVYVGRYAYYLKLFNWLLVLYRFARCLNFQKTSSVEETENTRPAYYKGHIRLPLIPLGVLSEFTNKDVVPIIMKAERFHGHLIASTNPVRVENIVCFLVDLNQLQEPKDLVSNDLGSWNQSKTAVKKYVFTTEKGHNITKITKKPDYAEGCYSVYRRTAELLSTRVIAHYGRLL